MNTVRDRFNHSTVWIAEKWSEDACDFARRHLNDLGITHLPGPHLDRVELIPIKHAVPSAVLRSLVGEPEECAEIKGNLLLNEGIQRVQDLTMIATVTSNQVAGNPWSNGNSYMGVGDTATAEAATQTELLATQNAANRFYKGMNATYPSRSSQTVSFQSDFTSTEANFIWNEWTVAAGATTASGSGFLVGTINLNRKVASLGTKTTGTWTLTAQITLS